MTDLQNAGRNTIARPALIQPQPHIQHQSKPQRRRNVLKYYLSPGHDPRKEHRISYLTSRCHPFARIYLIFPHRARFIPCALKSALTRKLLTLSVPALHWLCSSQISRVTPRTPRPHWQPNRCPSAFPFERTDPYHGAGGLAVPPSFTGVPIQRCPWVARPNQFAVLLLQRFLPPQLSLQPT